MPEEPLFYFNRPLTFQFAYAGMLVFVLANDLNKPVAKGKIPVLASLYGIIALETLAVVYWYPYERWQLSAQHHNRGYIPVFSGLFLICKIEFEDMAKAIWFSAAIGFVITNMTR